jgi:hypothetical protein
MTVRNSNWKQLQPYYESSASKRLAWEKNTVGFRDDDDTSKVSGIAKLWKDKSLKAVYDFGLSKEVEGISEDESKAILEVRKKYPVSKMAKVFIQDLMRQEAIKSLQAGGFQGSEDEGEAAIKSLIATKRFKAYIYQLAMSAEKTRPYLVYLANLIRDEIIRELGGQYDIASLRAWQANQLEVTEAGEDAFTVNIPPVVIPAQAKHNVDDFTDKLLELLSQLESAQTEEQDPSMQSIARSMAMPGNRTATNAEIYSWAHSLATAMSLI